MRSILFFFAGTNSAFALVDWASGKAWIAVAVVAACGLVAGLCS